MIRIKSKPLRVLMIYYLFLGANAIVFAFLKWNHSFWFKYGGGYTEFNPLWIPTIIGGLVALRLTVPLRSFKLFVIVYTCLWVLRFTLLYFANQIGEINFLQRTYRFDLIIYNYYKNVSRLDTHLPFVMYWFINYLFTIVIKQQEDKVTKTEENT
jgi:hypothetical protein